MKPTHTYRQYLSLRYWSLLLFLGILLLSSCSTSSERDPWREMTAGKKVYFYGLLPSQSSLEIGEKEQNQFASRLLNLQNEWQSKYNQSSSFSYRLSNRGDESLDQKLSEWWDLIDEETRTSHDLASPLKRIASLSQEYESGISSENRYQLRSKDYQTEDEFAVILLRTKHFPTTWKRKSPWILLDGVRFTSVIGSVRTSHRFLHWIPVDGNFSRSLKKILRAMTTGQEVPLFSSVSFLNDETKAQLLQEFIPMALKKLYELGDSLYEDNVYKDRTRDKEANVSIDLYPYCKELENLTDSTQCAQDRLDKLPDWFWDRYRSSDTKIGAETRKQLRFPLYYGEGKLLVNSTGFIRPDLYIDGNFQKTIYNPDSFAIPLKGGKASNTAEEHTIALHEKQRNRYIFWGAKENRE